MNEVQLKEKDWKNDWRLVPEVPRENLLAGQVARLPGS